MRAQNQTNQTNKQRKIDIKIKRLCKHLRKYSLFFSFGIYKYLPLSTTNVNVAHPE